MIHRTSACPVGDADRQHSLLPFAHSPDEFTCSEIANRIRIKRSRRGRPLCNSILFRLRPECAYRFAAFYVFVPTRANCRHSIRETTPQNQNYCETNAARETLVRRASDCASIFTAGSNEKSAQLSGEIASRISSKECAIHFVTNLRRCERNCAPNSGGSRPSSLRICRRRKFVQLRGRRDRLASVVSSVSHSSRIFIAFPLVNKL